jgi:hypothetical protein
MITIDMSRMSLPAADRLASCLHRTVLTGHRAFSSHARPHSYTSRRYSSMCQAASTASSTQLWQQVTTTYTRARELGAAKTTDSIVELYTDQRNGVEYVLRILANLAEKKATKPKLDSNSASPPKDFRNPFLPYEEDLWVQHLSDTHTLLLNKFNLVAHHVLVVTRQFESQQASGPSSSLQPDTTTCMRPQHIRYHSHPLLPHPARHALTATSPSLPSQPHTHSGSALPHPLHPPSHPTLATPPTGPPQRKRLRSHLASPAGHAQRRASLLQLRPPLRPQPAPQACPSRPPPSHRISAQRPTPPSRHRRNHALAAASPSRQQH